AVRLVAYPDAVFEGRIQDVGWAIAVEDGEPGAPPKVAPITNWVRIANRLPVRIALPPPLPGQPYRMGLTATVTVRRAS
ncbi:efflux transporter periplasmic adaptor subunit, partial [Vibrio parahaemolyticus]